MCPEITDYVNLYYSTSMTNTLFWTQLSIRTYNILMRVAFEKCYITVKRRDPILHTVKMRKANWIGNISYRNCLLKHVIEGTTEGRLEVTGRRCKQLLDELRIKEYKGNSKRKH
jgi:hypothetical protein